MLISPSVASSPPPSPPYVVDAGQEGDQECNKSKLGRLHREIGLESASGGEPKDSWALGGLEDSAVIDRLYAFCEEHKVHLGGLVYKGGLWIDAFVYAAQVDRLEGLWRHILGFQWHDVSDEDFAKNCINWVIRDLKADLGAERVVFEDELKACLKHFGFNEASWFHVFAQIPIYKDAAQEILGVILGRQVIKAHLLRKDMTVLPQAATSVSCELERWLLELMGDLRKKELGTFEVSTALLNRMAETGSLDDIVARPSGQSVRAFMAHALCLKYMRLSSKDISNFLRVKVIDEDSMTLIDFAGRLQGICDGEAAQYVVLPGINYFLLNGFVANCHHFKGADHAHTISYIGLIRYDVDLGQKKVVGIIAQNSWCKKDFQDELTRNLDQSRGAGREIPLLWSSHDIQLTEGDGSCAYYTDCLNRLFLKFLGSEHRGELDALVNGFVKADHLDREEAMYTLAGTVQIRMSALLTDFFESDGKLKEWVVQGSPGGGRRGAIIGQRMKFDRRLLRYLMA